uniref:Uncharacterized protein n=1 Tax=Anguilla anguilla TaxID=7936 RepID=A0A0E9UVP2_ANGAN
MKGLVIVASLNSERCFCHRITATG